jgi:hypothetical protein
MLPIFAGKYLKQNPPPVHYTSNTPPATLRSMSEAPNPDSLQQYISDRVHAASDRAEQPAEPDPCHRVQIEQPRDQETGKLRKSLLPQP